jgi:hypothetical protein
MAAPKVVVRRSPWKVMSIGLVGVPFVLLVVDYVWNVAGLFDRIIDWSYGAKDPEAWEPRDDIFAALLLLVGGLMVLFAIKELIAPRRLLQASSDGLRLPLSGPFGRRTSIGWLQVGDIETEPHAIVLHLAHAGGIPEDPWGARWTGDRTLRIPTWWWDRPPETVLDEIAEKGLPDAAQRRREEIAMEEARAHAAAMEVISGAAVVTDPTSDHALVPETDPPTDTEPPPESKGVGEGESDGNGTSADEEAGGDDAVDDEPDPDDAPPA